MCPQHRKADREGFGKEVYALAGPASVFIGLEDTARLRKHGDGLAPPFADRHLGRRDQLVHALVGPQLLGRAHLGFGDLTVKTPQRRQDMLRRFLVIESVVFRRIGRILRGRATGL